MLIAARFRAGVLGGVLLASALAVLAPRSARACSCVRIDLLEPRDGSSDVPTNAKIWYVPTTEIDGTTYRLVGPAGDVAVDAASFVADFPSPAFTGWVFTPRAPLTPGARYRFHVCRTPDSCVAGEGFTVGTRRAEAASLPTVLSRKATYIPGVLNSSCGPNPVRIVDFSFAWDGIVLLWDVDGKNTFSATNLGPLLRYGMSRRLYEFVMGVPIGSSFCTEWPSVPYMPKPEAQVRFGVLDVAGNFSGWTPAEVVALPNPPAPDGGVLDAQPADTAIGVTPDVAAPSDTAITTPTDAAPVLVDTAVTSPADAAPVLVDAAATGPADAATGAADAADASTPPAEPAGSCRCALGARSPGSTSGPLLLAALAALAALVRRARLRPAKRR